MCHITKIITDFHRSYTTSDGHHSHCKICFNTTTKIRKNNQRLKLIKDFGGICVKCNFDDPRALQFDHKNGGGNAEFRLLGSSKYYKKISKEPQKYQLLCANCNAIKRITNKEHRIGK